jgi:hypothetical protein
VYFSCVDDMQTTHEFVILLILQLDTFLSSVAQSVQCLTREWMTRVLVFRTIDK